MTSTRLLPVVVLAVGVAGPAAGQYRTPDYQYPVPTRAGVTPRQLPPVSADPTQAGPEAPPPRPATDRLEGMTAPPPARAADPMGTLAAAPPAPPGAGLPPGSYASPWFADGPGCTGPVGRHGLVAYELFFHTGASLPFGSGAYTDALFAGVRVGGGGRSLFFNPAGDAAWVVDLGLNYTYNRGSARDFLDMFVRQAPAQDPFNPNQIVQRPDRFATTRVRALHRTAFEWAVGRDWWTHGPGLPGAGDGWNIRWGTSVGGRWGTAHVDLVPQDEGIPDAYARRQGIFHGVVVAAHSDIEVPIGGCVWTSGWRVEYGYDWMNLAPPIKSDVQNVNLLLSTGFRF